MTHNWLEHAQPLILLGGAVIGVVAFLIRNALRVAKLEWQVEQLWKANQEENGKIESVLRDLKDHMRDYHDASSTST